jgi:entericidin B
MRMITAVLGLIAVFGLSACNTMQGFGKDIKSGGQAIENQAK